MSVEPRNIYTKDLSDFNKNIKDMNGIVFWRELKDDRGNSTNKVQIKIAMPHICYDGESITQKVRNLKD